VSFLIFLRLHHSSVPHVSRHLRIALMDDDARLQDVNYTQLKIKLNSFAENPPEEYALAAREGVNNNKERLFRAKYVRTIMDELLG
jgi:hypothetical protein